MIRNILKLVVLLLVAGQAVGASSFETQVTAGSDDAKTYNTGFSTTDIDAVVGSASGYSCDYLARFTDVNIPQGAAIDSAFLSLHCSSTQGGTTCNGLIYAEDTASAATFTSWNDYASRHLTGNAIAWNDIESHTLQTWYRTPDIKSIIQEIIDRGDWSSGQDLAVFVQDNNSDAGAFRRFYEYERPGSDGTSACSLLVFYTEGTSEEIIRPRRRRKAMDLIGSVITNDAAPRNFETMIVINLPFTGRQNEQDYFYCRADISVCEYPRRRYCE
jgi:hypothetical protein